MRLNRQFRSVSDSQFAENVVKVLLDRAIGQAQLKGDFLVRFGLSDQMDNLPFAKRKFLPGDCVADLSLAIPAPGAHVFTAEGTKTISAARAASRGGWQ